MEVTSVKNICTQLISLAIQRCRLSGNSCQLSVALSQSTISDRIITKISISDTGVGSCLKEFQEIEYPSNRLSAVEWGSVLSITTMSIQNAKISHYTLNLKESPPSRRLIELPLTKNNAISSGTEVSLSTTEDMDLLLADMTVFLKKMLVLRICNIAIELVSEDLHGLRSKHVSLELRLPFPESSNLERLTSGLEDYVYKHGNNLSEKCQSCFVRSDCLKVGSGQACEQMSMNDTLVVEAVIIITKSSGSESPSCSKAFEPKTEILYFRDFSPCIVDQSVLKALGSINWMNYGLSLKSIADDETAELAWANFPLHSHIDILLHCYNNQVFVPPLEQRIEVEMKLMMEAVNLAFDDLKAAEMTEISKLVKKMVVTEVDSSSSEVDSSSTEVVQKRLQFLESDVMREQVELVAGGMLLLQNNWKDLASELARIYVDPIAKVLKPMLFLTRLWSGLCGNTEGGGELLKGFDEIFKSHSPKDDISDEISELVAKEKLSCESRLVQRMTERKQAADQRCRKVLREAIELDLLRVDPQLLTIIEANRDVEVEQFMFNCFVELLGDAESSKVKPRSGKQKGRRKKNTSSRRSDPRKSLKFIFDGLKQRDEAGVILFSSYEFTVLSASQVEVANQLLNLDYWARRKVKVVGNRADVKQRCGNFGIDYEVVDS